MNYKQINYKQIKIAISLLLFVSVQIFSQNKIEFENISIAEGLSHSSVYAIAQDKNGFIYFGTGEGLDRFDGNNFIYMKHDPDNPNSLSRDDFGEILIDNKGIFWLSTWGGGVNRYDPISNTFTRFMHNPKDISSISSNRIENSLLDSFGNLWFGTERDGLNRFIKETGTFELFVHNSTNMNSLPNNQIKALLEVKIGNNNYLFIGTDDGIAYQDIAKLGDGFITIKKSPNGLSSNHIRALYQSNDGLIWIGTKGGGLCSFNFITKSFDVYKYSPYKNSISDNLISCIFEDSFNNLWIGTYNHGLNKFNSKQKVFTSYQHEININNSISSNRIESIFEDNSNNLWIGTLGGGVNKLNIKRSKFDNFVFNPSIKNSLPHQKVHAIIPFLSKNKLLVATDGGGISTLNIITKKFEQLKIISDDKLDLSKMRFWSLLLLDKNTLLAGSYYNGLYKIKLNSYPLKANNFKNNKNDEQSLSNNKIHDLYRAKNGNIWIGTKNGLNRMIFDENNRIYFKRYFNNPDNKNSISDNYINCISEDSLGHLWIGTSAGLNSFDFNTEIFTQFLVNSTIDEIEDIHTIYLEKYKNETQFIWIGTKGDGLKKFDLVNEKIVNIYGADKISSNTINKIFKDTNGVFWLSTQRGISSYDPKFGQVSNYSSNYGLKTLDFVRNSGCQLDNGIIFFGGTTGLVSFNPKFLSKSDFVPPVHITSLKVFNKELDANRFTFRTETLNLSYYENFITLEFTSLDYTNASNNKFYYKLEGIDDDWVYASNRRFASYSNLNPGTYNFKLKGSNSDENFTSDEKNLLIIITPPFWETVLFRISMVLLLLLLVYTLYRYRIYNITQNNNRLKSINESLKAEIIKRKQGEKELNIAKEEAEKSDKLKSEFLAQMSHEIRTPINSMMNFASLIKSNLQHNIDTDVEDCFNVIENAGERTIRTIDLILNMSDIQAGSYTFVKSKFNLVDDILLNLIGEFKYSAQKKGIELSLTNSSNNSVMEADHFSVTQILNNLIDNAIKYTRHGSVKIALKNYNKYSLEIQIADTGIGINEEYLPFLFEPFSQEEQGYTRKFDGNGLGLALVKKYCDMNNVQIYVESKKSIGTTFTIVFPLLIDT